MPTPSITPLSPSITFLWPPVSRFPAAGTLTSTLTSAHLTFPVLTAGCAVQACTKSCGWNQKVLRKPLRSRSVCPGLAQQAQVHGCTAMPRDRTRPWHHPAPLHIVYSISLLLLLPPWHTRPHPQCRMQVRRPHPEERQARGVHQGARGADPAKVVDREDQSVRAGTCGLQGRRVRLASGRRRVALKYA